MKRWIRFKRWLRWGTIRSREVDQINGISCEIEYRGRFGKVIGYWAYGTWDPELPYQGK